MTEKEFRNEMRRLGWSSEEINQKVAERNSDSREYDLPMPFEIYLSGKDLVRTYYVNPEGRIVDKE